VLCAAIPLTMTAGLVFGSISGTVIVSLSGTLAATVAFLIARYLARDKVRSLFHALVPVRGARSLMDACLKIACCLPQRGWQLPGSGSTCAYLTARIICLPAS